MSSGRSAEPKSLSRCCWVVFCCYCYCCCCCCYGYMSVSARVLFDGGLMRSENKNATTRLRCNATPGCLYIPRRTLCWSLTWSRIAPDIVESCARWRTRHGCMNAAMVSTTVASPTIVCSNLVGLWQGGGGREAIDHSKVLGVRKLSANFLSETFRLKMQNLDQKD